jgi:hypothetical protein
MLGAEYLRRERNTMRMEELAVRLIQKIYRGFRGRARYRRLMARFREQLRQKDLLETRLIQIRIIRLRRHILASRVQARVRGMIQRIRLDEMRRAALLIQTRIRVLLAQKHLQSEKQRQEGGPPVKEQLRQAIEINGMTVMVVIYRCENNYRICGQDLVSNAVYDCFLYTQEVIQLCNEHNQLIPGDTVADRQRYLKVWQHDRVSEYILRKIRLVKRITPLTRELGAAKHDSNLELVLFDQGNPNIRNLNDKADLRRGLYDQRDISKRYNTFFLEFEAKMNVKAKQARLLRINEAEKAKVAAKQLELDLSPNRKVSMRYTLLSPKKK